MRYPLLRMALITWLWSVRHNAEPVAVTSTAEEQTRVAVTVYNGGFGVVRDERNVALPIGEVVLRFMDVAAEVRPDTVQVEPVSAGSQCEVLEQNYEYDLLAPAKVLEKYVGQEVTLMERNPYKDTAVPVRAKLLSYNNAQPIYEIGGQIVLHKPHAETILPALPENLVARPTLTWLLHNAYTQRQTIATTYMSGGMSWEAAYVGVLAGDERTMRLNGWVTINNNSGATFKNAQLKLVAGDVQRAEPERVRAFMMAAEGAYAQKAPFAEEGMFEYHLYTLQRPTTLKQNQQKQIALLEAPCVRVSKTYRCIGESYWYRAAQGGTMRNLKIGVYVSFTNSAVNGLGMPLPKGVLRVYKADAGGNNQFIGEGRIEHTPKDEAIEVKLGNAFDIVAERRQTEYRVLGENVCELGWQITLRNHKEEDVVVEVVEPLGGDWEMLQHSHGYERRDAFTVAFKVPVARGKGAECTYRVRVRWR